MGWLNLPWELSQKFLGDMLNRRSVIGAVGGTATSALMKKRRQPWEKIRDKNAEAVLDLLTAYDVSRGAGKLLQGWLLYENATPDLDTIEKRFEALLKEADLQDKAPEDQARTRVILSKALFYLEGFRLSQCRYEDLQVQARQRLKRNPKWRDLSRRDVFLAKPFEPEELIGTTHRLLLMLSGGKPEAYLQHTLDASPLRDDSDYLAHLIALTAAEQDTEALTAKVHTWCREYRDFKIGQTNRNEAMLNTGLAAATGGLPAMAGFDLLNRAIRATFQKKKI
jgi:hypothetical protein